MKLDLSPEARLARRYERLGGKIVNYLASFGALGFAWSLWGWKGVGLVICLAIASHSDS